MRESDVQRDVVKFFRDLGCYVHVFSVGVTAKRRRQVKGAPDLYVIPKARAPFWFETKTPDGEASPEQLAFADRCRSAGVSVVFGGLKDATDFWNKGVGQFPTDFD